MRGDLDAAVMLAVFVEFDRGVTFAADRDKVLGSLAPHGGERVFVVVDLRRPVAAEKTVGALLLENLLADGSPERAVEIFAVG